MQAPADGFPLDALATAIASLRDDDAIEPRNAAMRAFLAQAVEADRPPTLADLLPAAADRAALAAGDAVSTSTVPPRVLSLVVGAGGRWLVAEPETSPAAALLVAARGRQLARFSASLVHDLSNLLGVAIGAAELAQLHTADPTERQSLAELVVGVRRGAQLALAIERQLRRSSRREITPLAAVLDSAQALLGKLSVHRGVALVFAREEPLPSIRTTVAEAVQAILHGATVGLDLGARELRIEAEAAEERIGGGRPRRIARVAVTLAGIGAEAARGLEAGLAAAPGSLTSVPRAPASLRELALARLAALACGGELAVVCAGADAVLMHRWPAVSPQRRPGPAE